MKGKCLYRYAGGELELYADLAPIHEGQSNDMVVAANGMAYIGNFGFILHEGETPRPPSWRGSMSTAACTWSPMN